MGINVKRWVTASTAIALMGSVLVGCGESGGGSQNASNEASKGTEKPFAGKKITFYMANHPWTDKVKSLLPEFESKTGMKVELQSFSEDQLNQKLTVQFTAAGASPDVFMHRPLQEGKLFFKNGWMQSLDDYVKKDAAYDFNDLSKSAVQSATFDGKLSSLPIISEPEIIYYRKDLLQKAGLSIPKTLDELEQAVKKVHDPNNGVFGFVARGQRAALVTQVSSFVFSEGGDFMQGDKAVLTTPEAMKGFTRYVNLLKQYGPPGVLNMSWPQAMGVFAQGKAVFYPDGASLYKNSIDPEKSTISDKVGYAVFPAGTAGSKPYNVTTWSLAMNNKSANKDAAWAFIQWATSKEIVLKTQQDGTPGVRDSVWNDPQGVSGFPADLVPVLKESAKIGVGHDRPVVISVGEARDAVGNIVIKGLLNEDMKAAAEKANQELQAIIDNDKGK